MTRRIRFLLGVAKILKMVLPKNIVTYVLGDRLVIKKIPSIGSLAGSMKSDIKLTDKQLRKARGDFEKHWAREM